MKKRVSQNFSRRAYYICIYYSTFIKYYTDMAKKRKLNSKNPRYHKVDDNAPKILKKKLMCNAKIRGYGGSDTGLTTPVYGIWYEN